MAAKPSSLIVRLVVLLAVSAGAILLAVQYKDREKSSKGEALRADVLRELAGADLPADGRAYVDSLAAWAHPAAYEVAFERGEEATGGTVHVDRYQSALLAAMIGRAREDGSPHIAAALEAFRAKAGIEMADDR